MSSSSAHPVTVTDDDSDEPVAIDPPPPARSRTRTRSTSARPSPQIDNAALEAPGPSRPKKRGRPRKNPVVEIEEPEEDDEVVFVRQTTVKSLVSKFTFAGSSTRGGRAESTLRSGSSSTRFSSVETESTLSTPATTAAPATAENWGSLMFSGAPFASSSRNKPDVPVPAWLGKTSTLNHLSACVLCRQEFKKKDSGAARWRHISTCLPPAYRPPNPAPDLQALVAASLEPPTRDYTLLERHAHTAAAGELLSTVVTEVEPIRRPSLPLTTVTASHSRSDWDEQVRSRVGEVVGHSSPIRDPGPSSPTYRGDSPSSSRSTSPDIPLTQTLGRSTLAGQFSRPPRTRSSSPEEGVYLIQAPPVLGLSQAVRDGFAREEAARTRRQAVSLSQSIAIDDDDDDEDDGGGFKYASQIPQSSTSASRPGGSHNLQPLTPRPKFNGGGFRSPSDLNPFPNWGGARSPGRLPSSSDSGRRGRLLRAIHVGIAQR